MNNVENNSNYFGKVVEISTLLPIQGADKIQVAIVDFNEVIVSKEVKPGDKMVYIQSGTRICAELCKRANLYSDAELNDNKTKGYLNKNRIVKAIKLKGVISNGLLLPLKQFDYLKEDFKVGDEFTHVNGVEIFDKYVPEVKVSQNTKKVLEVPDLFHFHNSTSNFRMNFTKINPEDIIGIHYKKHGTSAVFAHIPVERKLKWWENLASKFIRLQHKEYQIIYSSRTVIKNDNNTGYYSTDVWGEVYKEVKDRIPKGFTLYGEIIGYQSNGKEIQKGYDYGCKPGEKKFYVYRITFVNETGLVIELTDNQIKEFCDKSGFLYSDTFIYYGKAKDLFNIDVSQHWHETFVNKLEAAYNEKDCYMCKNKVPEEGIIIRKEGTFNYEAYKLKSKRFLLKEAGELEETNIEC